MMKGLDSKTQTSFYEDLKRSWESLAEPNAEGERQFDLLTNLLVLQCLFQISTFTLNKE